MDGLGGYHTSEISQAEKDNTVCYQLYVEPKR